MDYAENQAARQIPMKMADWVQRIDAFLQFNEYKLLKDAGKVSHDIAKRLAEEELEKFRVIQDRTFESEFDAAVKKVTPRKKDQQAVSNRSAMICNWAFDYFIQR